MADIEQTMVSELKTAEVAAGRIFPNRIEQGSVLPAVAYQAQRSPLIALDGALRMLRATVTLTVAADSYSDARSVAEAIRGAMQGTDAFSKQLIDEPGDEFDDETRLNLYTLVYNVWQNP